MHGIAKRTEGVAKTCLANENIMLISSSACKMKSETAVSNLCACLHSAELMLNQIKQVTPSDWELNPVASVRVATDTCRLTCFMSHAVPGTYISQASAVAHGNDIQAVGFL